MDTIGPEMVYSGVIAVIILMIVFSVPTIFLTVRGSSKMIKRYMILRSIADKENEDKVPKEVLNEWNAVKSPMVYITMISEQIEKLNNLRPLFFQAILAVIMSVILGFFAKYETSVLIMFIVIDVAAILGIIYGSVYMTIYKQEYLKILKELSNNDPSNGSADGMYG